MFSMGLIVNWNSVHFEKDERQFIDSFIIS